MVQFQNSASWWFDWMVAASWQIGLLICIVWLVAAASRNCSARFRYALWMLVLVKALLPTSLTTPISLGNWGIRPMMASTAVAKWVDATSAGHSSIAAAGEEWESAAVAQRPADRPQNAAYGSRLSIATQVFLIWSAGFVLFWTVLLVRYWRMARAICKAHLIDEGPIRIQTERIALELGLRRIPELVVGDFVSVPFLFGAIRPYIVLPQSHLAEMTEDELHPVLVHEMMHWRHCDTWIGWWQVVVQSVFWFHPLVWWANSQLRHERECACDEAVLRLGEISPRRYGESILRVLTVSRGKTNVAATLVGVFERGANLLNRLEEIMNFEEKRARFDWRSAILIVCFGVVFVPMSWMASGANQLSADDKKSLATPYPTIVETVPKIGETKVDASLSEIRVTFDRDMQTGMSWTGAPPQFPQTNEKQKARWIDNRTCVLPVMLEPGSYYRVGINSTSYQNFRAVDGTAAGHSAIYFTTSGNLDDRVQVPKVVKFEPANGAAEVDPNVTELRVTFDVPMGDGMSWCHTDGQFPSVPKDQSAVWSEDSRTCTLPVKLKSGSDYELSLNCFNAVNFQSKWGVPLAEVTYKFHTRKETKP